MKKYAVGWINFFDNDLQIKIVEIEESGNKSYDWRDALEAAFPGYAENVAFAGDNMDLAKEEAFNQEWLFDVKEI